MLAGSALHESWFYHFSCPHEPGDPRVLGVVAGSHAVGLVRRLLELHGARIADAGQGLADYLATWTAQPNTVSLDDVWDLAFGRAGWVLAGGKGEPADAALRVGLRLIERGHHGEWVAAVPSLNALRLGSLLLPMASGIIARRDHVGAAVTLLRPCGNELHAREVAPEVWHAEDTVALATLAPHLAVRLLPARALPCGGTDGQSFEGVSLCPTIDAAMVTRFADGAALLADRAPDYLQWIARVLRGISMCEPEVAFRAISGSGEHAPGVIHVSYPLGRTDIAEILVHESAHQYFYLLERLGPLEDGSDRRLYWSPPIRQERPLSRILMAYHALANVRLLYEALRGASGDADAYLDANLRPMDEAVAELDRPLRASGALTGLGRALYSPLARRIAALSQSGASA